MYNLDNDFKKFFPSKLFTLKDFQKKVIVNVLEHGNTLCIMPTGGGKSLIYWMTARKLSGITIVISPLTALIEEQALKLREEGFDTLVLHSGVSTKKQMKFLTDFAKGKNNPDFIFLSPEKIATDGLLEYCLSKRKCDIKLIVIDEVHCVSQWGMSFRPFYKRIPDFLDKLFGRDKWPKILALTATLNPKEVGDICQSFCIESGDILIDDLLMRSEIQLHVQKFSNEVEKTEQLWELLRRHEDEKILVYVYRKYNRHGVEDLFKIATEKGYKAAYFHGDMSADERMEIIDKLRDGEINVVFSTNAFGMGIDIPDIRVVIHFMIPDSVEQYYQEIGRAARDGFGANAYLLYSDKNIAVKKQYYIDGSFPNEEKLRETFKGLGSSAIGMYSLDYFGNDNIQECLHYFLETGLVDIICKGFSTLGSLTDITDERLKTLFNSTKNKYFISTIKKSDKINDPITPESLAELVYECIVTGKAKTTTPLDRRLIIRKNAVNIDETIMTQIQSSIEEKRKYKYALMDYFVYLLEKIEDIRDLHQEIAAYLGTEKHKLGKIYQTKNGIAVRSKSEVIIANLLVDAGIPYQYEEKLYYAPDKWIEPDFTIPCPDGSKMYWEHIGMLGIESYDQRWADKLEIYKKHFPEQLIKTYESGVLSKDATDIIAKRLSNLRKNTPAS